MSHRYSPPEIANLEALAGELPLGALARVHNRWAKKNGRPLRSERAIHQFLKDRGLAVEPIGDYVRTGTILRALGVSQSVVEKWVADGWIAPVLERSVPTRTISNPSRPPRIRRAFRRRDLVRMAKARPEAFAGAPFDGLFEVLEDDELAARIRREYPVRRGCLQERRPVMNVETRERYPSISAAAAATGLEPTLIRASILKGHKAKGTRWIDDPFSAKPAPCLGSVTSRPRSSSPSGTEPPKSAISTIASSYSIDSSPTPSRRSRGCRSPTPSGTSCSAAGSDPSRSSPG